MQEEARQYRLKITRALMVQGLAMGIKPDDMVEFFATQVQNMLMRPPNHRLVYPKIWILRGFYPGTPLFFKMSLSDRPDQGLYAKAQLLVFNSGYKDRAFVFDGNTINKVMADKMENIMLDGQNEIESLVPEKLKMPRCMSPKGMKLFRYEKPRKRRSRAKNN